MAVKLGAQTAIGTGRYAFDFVFLALLAWSGSILVVIIGYVGLQIASNTAHGPMQGLIPDESTGLTDGASQRAEEPDGNGRADHRFARGGVPAFTQ